MNRTQFEALRNLPDKIIRGDIRFVQRKATAPEVVAENLIIENAAKTDLRLSIRYNPQVGSKTFNVFMPGTGPICRLDVDGPAHRPAGRSHKHSLQGERCADRNLPDGVIDRADLSGKSLRALFVVFCELGQISHDGQFIAPDEP